VVQNDEQFTLDRLDGSPVRCINGVRVNVERHCNARVSSQACSRSVAARANGRRDSALHGSIADRIREQQPFQFRLFDYAAAERQEPGR